MLKLRLYRINILSAIAPPVSTVCLWRHEKVIWNIEWLEAEVLNAADKYTCTVGGFSCGFGFEMTGRAFAWVDLTCFERFTFKQKEYSNKNNKAQIRPDFFQDKCVTLSDVQRLPVIYTYNSQAHNKFAQQQIDGVA